MNDDDILAAARENAQEMGEYEKHVSSKAGLYSIMAGIILLVIMVILEWVIKKTLDCGKPALIFGISSIIDLYDGFTQKKKKTIVIGVIAGLLALFFLIAYIGVLLS